jgi:hypothetical protein
LTISKSVDAQSAKSYVLVGFIFYILGAAGWIIGFFASGIFMGGFVGPGMMGGSGMMGGFQSVFFIISVVFTVWAWLTMGNVDAGRYQDAQTASLILGIFGIFFAWLIGGIFLLLAYGKLGDLVRGQTANQATSQRSGRICTSCGRPVGWDAKFCEYCGKDLEHAGAT